MRIFCTGSVCGVLYEEYCTYNHFMLFLQDFEKHEIEWSVNYHFNILTRQVV